jgi:soluble lytic murein transglycosylase-like protein
LAPPPAAADRLAPEAVPSGRNWDLRPDAYAAGPLFDPAVGARLLSELARDHPALFPDAQAASDLARAGCFDLAAPLVARMYDAIDPAVGGTAHPEVTLSVAEWRQVFLLVRDNYHVARFSWGLHKGATTPEAAQAAWRLTYPTAEADALWRHGQRYNVDPLMALGLMRQESVYRPWALSPVGAIGLMQVMPRTGARIAARMGDATYSPDQLEQPATNVRYGVWYLSMLLDRFGGAWPLAVASYNGGPHNVSSWLRPFGENIPMDDFVESMPYPETRDYVKKVTGYYMAYTDLYGGPEDRVRIPMRVTRDDADIVNF